MIQLIMDDYLTPLPLFRFSRPGDTHGGKAGKKVEILTSGPSQNHMTNISVLESVLCDLAKELYLSLSIFQ